MNHLFKLVNVIFLVLLFSCGQNSKPETRSEPESRPKGISNNGANISYRTYGDGDITLLFVHGWCINQNYWSSQVEALKSDYTIVTIDLPGFGESLGDRDDWSIQDYASDVNAVIDQLKLKNVILIGHSMGAEVILETALNNKDILALVGVDNFKDIGEELTEEHKTAIDEFFTLLENNYTEIAQVFAENNLFYTYTDSLVKARVINDYINTDSVVAISSLKGLFNYSLNETNRLKLLDKNLYLINSNATPTNSKNLEAMGVKCTVLDIDSTGHFPMIEKPQEFNNLLRQAIEEIRKNSNLK